MTGSPSFDAASMSPWNVPARLSAFQLDLKDADRVPPAPDGKQQHVVETFDILVRHVGVSGIPASSRGG